MTRQADEPLRVVEATPEDVPSWLTLTAEAEPLFGPMLDDPGFHAALDRSIAQGRAYCVRAADGPPGTPLVGGLLWSARPPLCKVGWLAVTAKWRRQGVGRRLLAHALALVEPPAEVTVTTFAAGVAGGSAARPFYECMGFRPAEPAPPTPHGLPCQVYRLVFPPRSASGPA